MERIQALIDKLYEQRQQNATPAQLLLTVQLLQTELMKLQQRNGTMTSGKVAVTLPLNMNFTEEPAEQQPAPQVKKPVAEYVQPIPPQEEIKEPRPLKQGEETPRPVSALPPEIQKPLPEPAESKFPAAKEIHEVIAEKKESLNDRLKQDKTEVVHTLKDSPIKDLRKGIGINDRFTFVNELFRGDDAMYERSIKTINSFHILSEAEYWINRELKFKLGWNDSKEIVQHFYQLVRRRFS